MVETEKAHAKVAWKHLPDFAEFLLNNHLEEFLDTSYALLQENKVPLIFNLNFSEARALSNRSALELLISLTHHNPSEHVQKAIERWKNTQFPKVSRNKLVVDDVTLIGYCRKIAFLKFLPNFTTDPHAIIAVVAEIERYLLEYTATTFNAFVNIIDERINEHVQKLEQRTKELQDSNASLEEFAYVTSHDLKEPLRKISIFLDRLESLRDRATEKENEYLDKIQGSSLRMREMIEDLLSLSLISEDKNREETDLQKLLDEVLLTFEPRLEETKGIVTSDGLPKAPIVSAQFRQLFQNLISNSLKFIRPGMAPKIEFSHRYLEPNEMQVHFPGPARRYLEIRITDNGIGFDSEFAEKIFAVFQRLHQKNEYEGTGIGLAICRKIVKNHDGAITASGTVSAGATFIVTIPSEQPTIHPRVTDIDFS
jgi:signal transduction histidine kinase